MGPADSSFLSLRTSVEPPAQSPPSPSPSQPPFLRVFVPGARGAWVASGPRAFPPGSCTGYLSLIPWHPGILTLTSWHPYSPRMVCWHPFSYRMVSWHPFWIGTSRRCVRTSSWGHRIRTWGHRIRKWVIDRGGSENPTAGGPKIEFVDLGGVRKMRPKLSIFAVQKMAFSGFPYTCTSWPKSGQNHCFFVQTGGSIPQ